jgi:hypothetical protein
MRMISLIAATALIAASATAPITVAHAQEKKETVTEKVERNVKKAWKSLVGYKFVAACPVFFPVNHYNCTETGKNREEARAKCQAKHPFCGVGDAS